MRKWYVLVVMLVLVFSVIQPAIVSRKEGAVEAWGGDSKSHSDCDRWWHERSASYSDTAVWTTSGDAESGSWTKDKTSASGNDHLSWTNSGENFDFPWSEKRGDNCAPFPETPVPTAIPTGVPTGLPTGNPTEQPTDNPSTPQPPEATECLIPGSESWVDAVYTRDGNHDVSKDTTKGIYVIYSFNVDLNPIDTYIEIEKNGYPFVALKVGYNSTLQEYVCVISQVIQPTVTVTPPPPSATPSATPVATQTIVPVGVRPTEKPQTKAVSTATPIVVPTIKPTATPMPTEQNLAKGWIPTRPEKPMTLDINPGYPNEVLSNSNYFVEVKTNNETFRFNFTQGVVIDNLLQFGGKTMVPYGEAIVAHRGNDLGLDFNQLVNGDQVIVHGPTRIDIFVVTGILPNVPVDPFEAKMYAQQHPVLVFCNDDGTNINMISLWNLAWGDI